MAGVLGLGLVTGGVAGPTTAAAVEATNLYASPASSSAYVSGGPITRPLTVDGEWVSDPEGRVINMHGVNLINKAAPFYVSTFGEQDARFLASEGFTSARLGFSWAMVEPEPGRFDDSYIKKLVAKNDLLARYGIRTLLDVHVDSWGWAIPDWAGRGSGDAGYQAFWDDEPAPDGVGLQTHFLRMWRHVASFFADSENLLGYDPMNEPHAGLRYPQCVQFMTPCPSFESGQLAHFYRKVISAIRESDRDHIIWPEGVFGNQQEAEPALPDFDDPQVGVDFHMYCRASFGFVFLAAGTTGQPDLVDELAQAECPALEEKALGYFLSYAHRLGRPLLNGEFSAADTRKDNRRMVDLFGKNFVSWNIWDYYNSDVNLSGQGLLIDPSQPGSQANAKQAKLNDIVVPYPQAIAGTPQGYSYDRSTDTMRLSYSTEAAGPVPLARRALTQIFVPRRHYPTGYDVQVQGARVLSAPTAAWVKLRSDPGAGKVTVTITPRTGSTTEMPFVSGADSGPA